MSIIQEFLRYNRQTMLPEIGDEGQEKLKKARIAESDERNLAIANASWKTATIALLIAVYAEFLIAGISMPQVARAAEILIAIFFIVYLVSYRINAAKM